MRIFISRDLLPDEPLSRMLAARGHELRGRSLVVFEPVVFDEMPKADWLFFYSKNAVRFFFQNLENQKLVLPPVRFAAMGEGTATALEKHLNRPPDFTGDGDPVGTASQFLGEARGQKVVFVRAKNSRESIARLVAGGVDADDLVVYDNRAADKVAPLDDQVLVFTSPLNAHSYLTRNRLAKGQRIVAIGRTTAEMFEKLGFSNFATASEPTDDGLLQAILG